MATNLGTDLWSRIRQSEGDAGFFASAVLFMASIPALPAIVLHEMWQSLWAERHRRTAAEILFIAWTVSIVAVLNLLDSREYLVAIPALRLFDLLYARVFLLLRALPPQSSARSLLLV